MKTGRRESAIANDPVYHVGDLTVSPLRRVVLRDGQELSMGKLTFDLLLLMVEAAPGLISQQEMTERLWPARFVSEETVRQRIKLLRKALSDNPTSPRYLYVVRGQGICLIPPVETAARQPQVPGRHRLRYAATLAGTAIVVAIAAVLLVPSVTRQSDVGSLAVLPFEALSPVPEDAHFADGFHNDLLTQLASIRDLKVISRTSVLDYRDNPRNIQDIARELDVATILEGSIQRAGQHVRINAQLIDARTDRHLWAQVYDRELTAHSLFDIQAELAVAITDALQVELSPRENTRIRSIPTESTRAYNQYLLGQYYSHGLISLENYRLAIDAFQQAVTEDPEFAVAWAALARAHSTIYFFRERTDERRELAKAAATRALEIDPDLPEAHLAQGIYRHHAESDYQGALSAWRTAELGMPGDPRLFEARAAVYGRMGQNLRSVHNWRRAVELDPRDEHKLTSLAWQLAMIGEYDASKNALKRLIALAPDSPIGYRRLAYLPLWRDGDGAAVREELAAAPITVRAFAMEWLAAIYERDFNAAIAVLEEWPGDGVDTHLQFRTKSWFYGTTLKLSGDNVAAESYFLDANERVEHLLEKSPQDPRLLLALADIKANLGENRRAVALTNEVLNSMKVSDDASLNSQLRLTAIRALIAAGEFDAALRELETYLSGPATWSAEGLLPDPRFDPVRNKPQFSALIDRHARS